MSAKLLFSISSAFFFVYGIGGILLPTAFLPLFGFTPDPPLVLMARLGASASVTIAVILWLSRKLTDWRSIRPIAIGAFVGYALGGATSLAGTVSQVMGPVGWVSVLTNALLTVAYGYLIFLRKAA